MIKSIFTFLTGVLLTFMVTAQPEPTYTIKEKRAIKKYESCLELYRTREYKELTAALVEINNQYPDFAEAHFLYAQVLMDQGQFDAAVEPLEKGVNLHPEVFPEAYLILAERYQKQARYAQAEKTISKYIPLPKNDVTLERKAQLILASCVYAQQAMKYPVDFQPVNLGKGVNTSMDEYYPCITADEGVILFTRLVKDDRVQGGFQEDFYLSRRAADGTYTPAQPVQSINTLMNEGAPSLGADGKTLIFTACQTADGVWGGDRQGVGSCDLFYSIFSNGNWQPAKNLGSAINSTLWESQPSYSADGRTLYFVRGKRSAHGITDMDIYYSVLKDNGQWTKPEKVPGLVNTPFQEESVMIHPDGNTLYFSSDGHPGLGGLDIFMSRRDVSGNWAKPINLGYPINSEKDENSFQVTADGQFALMASERAGGEGGLDLYRFALDPKLQPKRVSYVEGIITDALSFKKLDAQIQLLDMATGQEIASTFSGVGTGHFLLCIPPGKDYIFNVSKDGYLFHTERFALLDEVQKEPKKLNVALKKLEVGTKITLNNGVDAKSKNVFFDTNSDVLKKEAYVELDKLVELLNKNPKRKIEVGGHTDDQGDDALNMNLSVRRAEAVKNYLVLKGIGADRLVAKGYGETQPTVPNTNDENRAKNRRTEFVILE